MEIFQAIRLSWALKEANPEEMNTWRLWLEVHMEVHKSQWPDLHTSLNDKDKIQIIGVTPLRGGPWSPVH